jgi:hypothetical protein
VKRRAWKLVLGILGGMVLIGGLVVGDAHRRAAATFAWHEKEVAVMIGAIRAREASRPTLYSDPSSENGWEAYLKVFKAFEDMPAEQKAGFQETGDSGEGEAADDHLLHGILSEYGPQVLLLEKAARCRRIEPDYDYQAEDGPSLDWISGSISAAQFLQAAATHHHRMGNPPESLRLTTLGLSVAQDLSRKGPVICALLQFVAEYRICEGMREVFASGHSFTAVDLDRFASQLDTLGAHRPSMLEAWSAEEAYVRHLLLRRNWSQVSFGASSVKLKPTWRQFFSDRIMQAQALNVVADVMPRAGRMGSLPLSEHVRQMDALIGDVEADRNPVVAELLPSLLKIFHRDRVMLLARTLLRVSVAVARYQIDRGQDPDRLEDLVPRYLAKVPECPMTGTALRYANGRLWSIGINRIDDGGREAEYGSPDEGGDGDVVWTVRRK